MNNAEQHQTVTPATDIVEMNEGVHIFVDLPGVPAEGLSIDLEEDEITIRGKSAYTGMSGKDAKPLHKEFEAHTRFERTFTLSDMVDRENIKATLTDGVLDLFLPRSEAMKPKKIPVSAG